MAEYIEREETIRRAIDACIKIQFARTGVGITQFEAIDMAEAIHEIPTADVVEVVRCKDCVYCEDKLFCICPGQTYLSVTANHFCGHGVKMDGKGEG